MDNDEIINNPDGRPLAQLFYDDIHKVIEKYESTGITNAECIGVLELLKIDMAVQMNTEEKD